MQSDSDDNSSAAEVIGKEERVVGVATYAAHHSTQ